jgi:tetratricopeptide (TPR) repeat protein
MSSLPARLLLLIALGCGVSISGCNLERNESVRMMNKGIAAYRGKRTSEAIKLLQQAVDKDPSNQQAFRVLGMIQYQRVADLESGEANLRKAIQLKPDDYDAQYHLGALLMDKKEWRPASSAFEAAIKIKPDHAESHLRLGRAQETLEKYDRAQEAYRESIKANPRRPEAYNALGSLYMRFERYPQAAQVLKNAIENNREYAPNYRDIGLVYKEQKRFPDAIRQLEKARLLDPGNATVLFNLGMTYISAKDGPKALDNLRAYLSRRTAREDPIRVSTARDIIARLEKLAPR